MKTTIYLDDNLVEQVRRLSDLKEKTAIVHAGLEALVQKLAAERLAAMQGQIPELKKIPRRRMNRE